MKLFDWIGKLFDWLDNIEFAVIGSVAALLLIAGPLFITYRFVLAHRTGAALLAGALWLCCVAICIRDFRRQQFSWVSGGILILWFVTTLALGFAVA